MSEIIIKREELALMKIIERKYKNKKYIEIDEQGLIIELSIDEFFEDLYIFCNNFSGRLKELLCCGFTCYADDYVFGIIDEKSIDTLDEIIRLMIKFYPNINYVSVDGEYHDGNSGYWVEIFRFLLSSNMHRVFQNPVELTRVRDCLTKYKEVWFEKTPDMIDDVCLELI